MFSPIHRIHPLFFQLKPGKPDLLPANIFLHPACKFTELVSYRRPKCPRFPGPFESQSYATLSFSLMKALFIFCKSFIHLSSNFDILLGNKAPPLGWGSIGWQCQSNGSAWHSSPLRIYSYAASGPPCGLLEQNDMDSIGALQCRPRLGPRHGAEGFLSERGVLSKTPIPSPHQYAVMEHPYGVLNIKLRPLGGASLLCSSLFADTCLCFVI